MTKNKSQTKIEKKYDENGSLIQDTKGMSTVEYLILLVIIGVASIALWTRIGKKTTDMATQSATQLEGIAAPTTAQ
tara:strand:- start:13873 stop:14100 length:228 start_codon:yes stop_codon:yes gene_type:complete